MEEFTTYAIGVFVVGIIITIIMEMRNNRHKPKVKINYKSIFPTTKDQWTTKVFEIETMSRNPQRRRMASMNHFSSSSRVKDDDPYTHPGMDAFIDEAHHGMDRGLGIVTPHDDGSMHHDHHH